MKKQLIVGLFCMAFNPSVNAMGAHADEQEAWNVLRQLSMQQRQVFTSRFLRQELLDSVKKGEQSDGNRQLQCQIAILEREATRQQESIDAIANNLFKYAIINSLPKIEAELQKYSELLKVFTDAPVAVSAIVQDPDTLIDRAMSMNYDRYYAIKIAQLQKLKRNLQDQLDQLK